MKTFVKKLYLPALCIMLTCIFAGISVHNASFAKAVRNVDVVLGKAEMVSLLDNISDILIADPSVVDVSAVKTNRMYLVGTSLGDTNIIVLNAGGDIIETLNVHVHMDTNRLERMVKKLYPNENVAIDALSDQIIITGEVSNPAVSNKIANLVAKYVAGVKGGDAGKVDDIITNMLGVRGQQQVMLKVKIVEASRSALKDLGVETNYTDGNLGVVGTALATASALGLTAPSQLGVLSLNYDSGGFGPLNMLVRALEKEGIVNTLAEPNLTAISGEQAGFLAGGEFPIPTQIDRNGNLIYEFRPFGVSLNFRPIVMSGNRITLEMTTEVSTTSFDQNLQLNGVNVPTFNVRRAETTVELPSGGTLMIAGLIKSDTVSGLTKLPGIGDVPVVGNLMKSDTFQRGESELVVIITPYLVEPFANNNSQPQQATGADISAGNAANAINGNLQNSALMTPSLPESPGEKSSKGRDIFMNNIKRAYGKNAPLKLMSGDSKFGYVFD